MEWRRLCLLFALLGVGFGCGYAAKHDAEESAGFNKGYKAAIRDTEDIIILEIKTGDPNTDFGKLLRWFNSRVNEKQL